METHAPLAVEWCQKRIAAPDGLRDRRHLRVDERVATAAVEDETLLEELMGKGRLQSTGEADQLVSPCVVDEMLQDHVDRAIVGGAGSGRSRS